MQEAALAYDICKLHVACTWQSDIKLEEVKLNNSTDTYLNNVAFINLRDNATTEECAGLIKSGVLLEQFGQRYRPVLRTTSHHRGSTAHPKREPSPHPQHQQQPHQPPARTQSQAPERDHGGARSSGVPEPAAAQPAAAAEREPPEPVPTPAAARSPPGKASAAAAGAAAAAAADGEEGEEEKKKSKDDDDEKKKRKARWVLYPPKPQDGLVPLHTIWISERTASGNSLSIPGALWGSRAGCARGTGASISWQYCASGLLAMWEAGRQQPLQASLMKTQQWETELEQMCFDCTAALSAYC